MNVINQSIGQVTVDMMLNRKNQVPINFCSAMSIAKYYQRNCTLRCQHEFHRAKSDKHIPRYRFLFALTNTVFGRIKAQNSVITVIQVY
jgi:hypothetical protein